MSLPAPTRADHAHFCETEGWTRVRDARGRKGTHHLTCELTLDDGRILRTRVSHPPDRTDYGPALWKHILRDQLDVTDEEFWACVKEGIRPNRGTRARPPDTLPADLVYQLVVKFRVPESEVAQMTKAEAIARLQALWSQQA